MQHPYTALPARAYWRSGVAETDRDGIAGLYVPKFPITRSTAIATAGSCFAQHIGLHLRHAGCHVLDAEPAPDAMPENVARAFGYGVYSARYGNIYTARQLLDLLREVTLGTPDPRFVWEAAGRFHDAFRLSVEPHGLDSMAEVLQLRRHHLRRIAGLLAQTELLIFTLGLTETWADRLTGRVFPVCPGVKAGTFDPEQHQLLNLTHAQNLTDLADCLALLKGFNPNMKLLLTVSPVPLTATASGDHVLTATSWSKSTLRGVAGEFSTHPDVDYMPSYELITHPGAQPQNGGHWFAPNLRSVSQAGVARVMRVFLSAHGLDPQAKFATPAKASALAEPEDGLVCDDILLDTFGTDAAQ